MYSMASITMCSMKFHRSVPGLAFWVLSFWFCKLDGEIGHEEGLIAKVLNSVNTVGIHACLDNVHLIQMVRVM